MNFTLCPPAQNGFPIYTWDNNNKKISPGSSVAVNLGTGNYLTIECISGNIYDDNTGHPNFQFVLRAPNYNAEADLTPYVDDNKKVCQGIWVGNTWYYNNSNGDVVNTLYQLIFRNLNTGGNVNFNFSFTFGFSNGQTSRLVVTNKNSLHPIHLVSTTVLDNFEENSIDLKWISSPSWPVDHSEMEREASFTAPPLSPLQDGPCVANCTPSGYLPIENCTWYTKQPWLPWNYASAAACACTLQDTPGQLSNTAMCVRNYLMTNHQGSSYFTDAQKQQFAENIASVCWLIPKTNVQACVMGPPYWNTANAMLPTIYKMHQDAYRTCCCPHAVAPYYDWVGIFYAPFANMLLIPASCYVQVQFIEVFGPCGCDQW